ncbi:TetR/AcrR family transcriptional regulator [Amycolatopsis sp. 195334CR]|uniref:TetR/AcrR family transcriptional regulator n=1 Tax=Amycolatopsis sp. 195334CR TaxID=2814588 RepID=UPI001A8DEE85|nr:TetR/AcrR family transcriptional regulator [Amycolatopsis sp. 195334CR]MBN6039961.1 TetR family transcriptional regulator [Amycolatopsis sp. 195334CR]
MAGKRGYHHGDLPAALIRTSFEVLAEQGPAAFSVAQVARRLGISTASPYRHFRDRDHLFAAVATAAARELAEAVRAAVDAAGADPAERFAVAGSAYLRFAVGRGVGFDVIYASDLAALRDEELATAGRELMDLFTGLADDTGERTKPESLELVANLIALAHGYAALYRNGLFASGRYRLEDLLAQAENGGRALAATRGARPR